MLFVRTRPFLSDARTVLKPDHLRPFGAGWRALSGSLHVPHTNAQLRAAQQAWPRSQLASPPLSLASPPTAGSKLQTSTQLLDLPRLLRSFFRLTVRLPDLSRLTARTFRALLHRVRGAKFELRSPISDPPLAPPPQSF